MKFKFALQKVLEHRKTLENIAQRDFQQVLQKFKKEVELLNTMKEDKHQAFYQGLNIHAKDKKYIPPRLQQTHEYLLGQDKRIERQTAKVQEMELEVEKYREILREKVISTKIIDKLKEKKYKTFLAEQNILEQKELDELNVIRFDREENE